MYMPAIVSVGYYFETKRAFATGIAVSGSGIGTFVMAPLAKALLNTYDWKGATLIFAGIVLNGVVFGALIRPLEVKPPKEEPKPLLMRMWEDKQIRVRAFTVHDGYDECQVQSPLLIKTQPHAHNSGDSGFRSRGSCPSNKAEKLSGSESNVQHADKMKVESPPKTFPILPPSVAALRQERELSSSTGAIDNNNHNLQVPSFRERVQSLGHPRMRNSQILHKGSSRDIRQEYKRPMYRKDIFYSGSVMNLPQFRRTKNMNDYLTSITAIPRVAPENEAPKQGWMEKVLGPEMGTILEEMLDVSLLKNPVFILICVANILAFLGFFIPFVYTTARAIEIGISSEKAALLLSIIGIANTGSRVVAGWVSDRPGVNPLWINNCCLLVSGVITMFVPLYPSFWMLAIYCFVFGVAVGKLLVLLNQ